MAINPPVDATKTPEWAALQKHYDELQSEGISLKQWFADDAERVEKLSFDAGDLHFDLSKNLIKPETLQLFADLAKAVKLDERTKAMYTGVHINNTEDRAVLHTALRRPVEDEGKYIVDGQDTVKDVREVLDRIYAFADKVRSGEWTGVTGKKIETVVNIGIGGSDLGPVMVYEALKPYADAGISARHQEALRRRLHQPGEGRRVRHRPEQRVRLLELGRRPLLRRFRRRHLPRRGLRPGPLRGVPARLPRDRRILRQHPVREERRRAARHAERVVPQLLQGRLPRRAAVRPVSAPLPGLPAAADHGVQRQVRALGRHPGHLRDRRDQHAFYQLIHQGTQLIPADFIAFVNTPNPTKDGDQDVHELFLGNYFAQTKALAFGKTADEVRAEGTPEEIVPARVFTGNRPTTSIFGVALTPFALGELIALYEHITFVEGTVWGLDSYDQWGVELGKQLAKQITPAISKDDAALAAQDPSTQSLIKFYRANREF